MDKLYPWLNETWADWLKRIEGKGIPNANLVVAPDGVGAHDLIQHLVAVLLCEDQSTQACGFCHSCQLVASGNHPDYHVISPEKEGKAIGVEQIRHVNRVAMESSQLFGPRVIVIEPAENMNTSASNALLKTLEEPPENCLFVLRTSNLQMLLPTIVSRCQQWFIPTPMPEVTLNWLATKGFSDVQAHVLKLNDASPLLSERFIREGQIEEYKSAEKAFIDFICQGSDVSVTAKAIDRHGNRSLKWLWHLLADAQKAHFLPAIADTLPGAKALCEAKPYSTLYNQSKSLSELMAKFDAFPGLNRDLMIADWLFKFDEDTCL